MSNEDPKRQPNLKKSKPRPPAPAPSASEPQPERASKRTTRAEADLLRDQLGGARSRISELESNLAASRVESTQLAKELHLFRAGQDPKWAPDHLQAALQQGDPADGPFGAVLVLLERARLDMIEEAEQLAAAANENAAGVLLAAARLRRLLADIRTITAAEGEDWQIRKRRSLGYRENE